MSESRDPMPVNRSGSESVSTPMGHGKTTSQQPLVQFLNARLDEDEQYAGLGLKGNPRLLRDVVAKRAILAAWEADVRMAASYGDLEPEWSIARRTAFQHACVMLSQAYSDHPDYRQNWS